MTRNQRKRIAAIMREAVDVLDAAGDNIALTKMIANIVHQGFVWEDLTVDVCIALATFTPPAKRIDFPTHAQILGRLVCQGRPQIQPGIPSYWVPIFTETSDVRWYAQGLVTRDVQ